ncbi:MAG: A/G-specific adenine glycosylase, partial [Clostridia bacterium]|nr:A/G-specific adenine glycosylase [Clostridia bacterium]
MVSYSKIVSPLLDWYEKNHRNLPWREGNDPYRIWVSEIMLQQTRVEAVKDYYSRFLQAFPTVYHLAQATEDSLMKLWEGLGYYSRAKNLQKAAKIIVERYDGKFPGVYEDILSLPGVGEYTAGAIASIAFNLPYAAVDGNVLRVLSRLSADDAFIDDPKTKKRAFEA